MNRFDRPGGVDSLKDRLRLTTNLPGRCECQSVDPDEVCGEAGLEILALSGSLDADYAPTLGSMLQNKLEAKCPALILDLTEVDSIDSICLEMLLKYYRESARHGGLLAVTGVKDGLRSSCDIAELERIVPVYSTVAEASAALSRAEERTSEKASTD